MGRHRQSPGGSYGFNSVSCRQFRLFHVQLERLAEDNDQTLLAYCLHNVVAPLLPPRGDVLIPALDDGFQSLQCQYEHQGMRAYQEFVEYGSVGTVGDTQVISIEAHTKELESIRECGGSLAAYKH